MNQGTWQLRVYLGRDAENRVHHRHVTFKLSDDPTQLSTIFDDGFESACGTLWSGFQTPLATFLRLLVIFTNSPATPGRVMQHS